MVTEKRDDDAAESSRSKAYNRDDEFDCSKWVERKAANHVRRLDVSW